MCPSGFRYLLLLIASGFCCVGCNKVGRFAVGASPLQDSILLDQPYGNDPAQRVDVYLPEGRVSSETCSMVFIHGGGWTTGDKQDFTDAVKEWRRRYPKYAFFNMNYRLATPREHHFPSQEEDMQLMIDYIRQHSAAFNITTRKVLLGASAGAHLAALQAYKHNDSADITGIICLYGAYDISSLFAEGTPYVRNLVMQLMGAMPEEIPVNYEDASPVHYVNSKSPPTLLMHGSEDSVAPVTSARALAAKLKAMQVPVQYIEYKYGHGVPPEAAIGAIQQMGDFNLRYNK
ncbi:alpha/beta hydrolase [Chitinophaga pendula]|uniref:alpha/beta hydrolase n=1 Tax=Chitinophaga TaxID=79328 RepID=UPI000BAF3548|nr:MULTISPECIES: alpha/beta hydrolase [Chitinophaga]ASZ14735.1 hypothetical protein CK934_29210 [Chitinophaga sp. MD30]UCJ07606.1 alpha/beta hydrolase [Chitinophaga pendula]